MRMATLALALLAILGSAAASEGHVLRHVGLPDTAANRLAGARVVTTVCHGCHDFRFLTYGDLAAVGLEKAEIDALRVDKPLSAPFLSVMPAEARLVSFGRLPPDLSLITRAREGGADYVYTLLTSFGLAGDGNIDNALFPGIKMPDILGISATAPGSPERAGLARKAQQAALFLEWAADPHADERKHLGIYVLLYLGVLSGLLYRIKQRVWARLPAFSGEDAQKGA